MIDPNSKSTYKDPVSSGEISSLSGVLNSFIMNPFKKNNVNFERQKYIIYLMIALGVLGLSILSLFIFPQIWFSLLTNIQYLGDDYSALHKTSDINTIQTTVIGENRIDFAGLSFKSPWGNGTDINVDSETSSTITFTNGNKITMESQVSSIEYADISEISSYIYSKNSDTTSMSDWFINKSILDEDISKISIISSFSDAYSSYKVMQLKAQKVKGFENFTTYSKNQHMIVLFKGNAKNDVKYKVEIYPENADRYDISIYGDSISSEDINTILTSISVIY